MDKLGRYQIREMIGEGAMARVYKAYDPEIDRTLAIKVLKPQLANDEQYRGRFLREAKAAGVLSHPNIVTIFDVGDEGDVPYIAMELIDGKTLSDLIRSGREFTVAEVVEIGIQLTRALDYAHKKGIVHRDVKPGNVMMSEDRNAIKVTDFGICRIDGRDATELTQDTQLGNVLGTPNYMSPEQVAGEKVDSRSDLFSVGVVLYQLVTGQLPFEGDTLISVAYKITKTEAPSLDKLRRDVPLSLRRAIERALKKQPEKRFQTGEEFAQALIGVARELAEEEQRRGAKRGLSLGVRWALMMAALVAITMTRRRDGALQAAVRGDDGPGQGLRRVARQVHGDAERGAAPVGGLGGDGRVRAGDARPPGLRLHPRRRPRGHRARQQRRGRGREEVRGAAGDAAVVAAIPA